jgi:hypothetical protein
MRAFIVPAETPGCIIGAEHNLAALEYARTASISFENINFA